LLDLERLGSKSIAGWKDVVFVQLGASFGESFSKFIKMISQFGCKRYLTRVFRLQKATRVSFKISRYTTSSIFTIFQASFLICVLE